MSGMAKELWQRSQRSAQPSTTPQRMSFIELYHGMLSWTQEDMLLLDLNLSKLCSIMESFKKEVIDITNVWTVRFFGAHLSCHEYIRSEDGRRHEKFKEARILHDGSTTITTEFFKFGPGNTCELKTNTHRIESQSALQFSLRCARDPPETAMQAATLTIMSNATFLQHRTEQLECTTKGKAEESDNFELRLLEPSFVDEAGNRRWPPLTTKVLRIGADFRSTSNR